MAIYAARRTADNAVTIVVINKTNNSMTVNLTLTGATATATAQVYRYSAANLTAIVRDAANQPINAAGTSQTFPANSITLFIVPLSATATYTVTPTAGTGGNVSPSTAQTVNSGTTAQFTITPNSGYATSSTVGGTCPQGSWNTGNTVWTTGAITANCTVSFSFTPVTYTVTPAAGTGGSVSPNTAQSVSAGAKPQFTVTSNTGYTTNAAVGGTCPQGSWNTGNTIWNTGGITASCTVSFSFTPVTYTVTPAAGTGGTISPNTAQTVNYGTTTVFTVTPNSGYNIASVTGCGGGLSGNTYTTGPITSNCTVTAAFSANTPAGNWTATGSMSTARTGHTATLLGNGQVLVAGGWNE